VTHLRRYLERTGVVLADDLDMALRRQQIYGGSLDTVFLELDVVDPHTLGELLVQACGLPLAPWELIDDERDRPWDRLPDDVLEIGWAVPLVAQGEEVWIAVHPDLPNERLGALYRSIPSVHPFVAPECCIEKIAAERTASVVPQRYAVLCVAYLSALRRRPSVSDVGFPMLQDGGSYGSSSIFVDSNSRRPAGSVPIGAADPDLMPLGALPVLDDEFERRPTMVFESKSDPPPSQRPRTKLMAGLPRHTPEPDEPVPSPDPSPVPDKNPTPDPVPHPDPIPDPAPSPVPSSELPPDPQGVPAYMARAGDGNERPQPIVLEPTSTIVGGAPPVRFTARGTMISTPRELETAFSEADVVGRLAGARAVLEAARTRDAVIDAFVQALTVLTPRVGMFRIRTGELFGLSSPRSALPDLGGKLVPIGDDGVVVRALATGRSAGLVEDPRLREAVGLAEPVPCLIRRIDVASRPVLLAYLDHGGREFLRAEATLLDELCLSASRAFSTVLMLRAGHAGEDSMVRPLPSSMAGIGPPPSWGGLSTSEARSEASWPPPPIQVRTAMASRASADVDGNPVATRTPEPRVRKTIVEGSPSPHPVPPRVHDNGEQRVTEPYSPEPAAANQPPHGEALAQRWVDDERPRGGGSMVTILAMPPPPPLPPPPPMAEDSGTLRKHDTLTGLPPPVSSLDVGPRFLPPPMDDRENSGIIPLSSPIDQPSMRGRIALDDDDWNHPGKQLASESMQRRIDALLRSIATGSGNLAELRALGEPALLRLAAQFPGPLEVLRRDLKALPPPSAHGPLVRTTIRLGADVVPHLVDLFDHPSPDVRFYAAFVFQELRDARCMRPLSELAFDTSGDVRVISMRVLETYNRAPGFMDAVRVVRAQLDSTNRTRQLYAARAVGTLRDIEAIPKLVDLLSSRDRFVQEAALESLCSITGQQHGIKPHRWKSWHIENAERHRVEWIIESLRHRDLPVRRWAADELTRITGHRVAFSPMGDRKARDMAVQAWTEWWAGTGRAVLARE
jgi:hypothetical protein